MSLKGFGEAVGLHMIWGGGMVYLNGLFNYRGLINWNNLSWEFYIQLYSALF